MSNNCSEIDPAQWLAIPSIPDITGFGVLIGFIAPAYILYLILCIYYIFTYQPSLEPFRKYGDQQSRCVRPNPIDEMLLRVIRKALRIQSPQNRRPTISWSLQRVFEKCVLSIADIQIVTGLGLLTAGYFTRWSLSALHWKMIVYLAFFSCSTHISALHFLSNYMINHPIQKAVRLTAMFILLVVLVIALVPTAHFYWYGLFWSLKGNSDAAGPNTQYEIDAPPSANVTCYLDANSKSSKGRNTMLLSISFLVLGFIFRLMRLHKEVSWLKMDFISHFALKKLLASAGFFQRYFGTARVEERFVSNVIVSAHFVACIWIDLCTSIAAEVFLLAVSHTWGTLRIFDLRQILSSSSLAQDFTWSFGQVLPVVLLAGPCCALVEHFLKYILLHKMSNTILHENSTLPTESATTSEHESSHRVPTTAETTVTSPSEGRTWDLRPELFDAYYTRSSWMFWVVSACTVHACYLTRVILGDDFLPKLYDEPVDTVSRIGLVMQWFMFTQGFILHILIMILSFLEAKLNHHYYVTHAAMFIMAGGFTALSVCSVEQFRYNILFLPALGSVALFIFAIAIKSVFQAVRKSRHDTPENVEEQNGEAC